MIAPSLAAFYATLIYVIVAGLVTGWILGGRYAPSRRFGKAVIGISTGLVLYLSSILIYYELHDRFWRAARPELNGMSPTIGVGPLFTPGAIGALVVGEVLGFLLSRVKRSRATN